ncbi:MAG TPA: Gmad2 immunoglobulin-like domain-containing protein [Flavobacterium sp.]|jgi:hypothetical protein
MKILISILAILLLVSCQNEKRELPAETPVVEADTSSRPPVQTVEKLPIHANERFRNVTVEKLEDNKYKVSGEGQIFEASFGWVVEDGHNELKKGFAMTDAGAPAWGKFNFFIDAAKERENSTLILILFETSAKDGSRVHELPITLNQ